METITNEDAYYLGMLAGFNICHNLKNDPELDRAIFYLVDKILKFAPHLIDVMYKENERELGQKLMESFNIAPSDLITANSK